MNCQPSCDQNEKQRRPCCRLQGHLGWTHRGTFAFNPCSGSCSLILNSRQTISGSRTQTEGRGHVSDTLQRILDHKNAVAVHSSEGCRATDKVFFALLLSTNSAPGLERHVKLTSSLGGYITHPAQITNSGDMTTETFRGHKQESE